METNTERSESGVVWCGLSYRVHRFFVVFVVEFEHYKTFKMLNCIENNKVEIKKKTIHIEVHIQRRSEEHPQFQFLF